MRESCTARGHDVIMRFIFSAFLSRPHLMIFILNYLMLQLVLKGMQRQWVECMGDALGTHRHSGGDNYMDISLTTSWTGMISISNVLYALKSL